MAKRPKEEPKVIRYIVTVHGIGEQRKNETILEPIFRFAKARRLGADIANPLSLGQISGLSDENGWISFEGIPVKPPQKGSSEEMKLQKEPFFARPDQQPERGENLRFVDLHWANVMQDEFANVGVPLKIWATSMLNRAESQSVPNWAIHLLKNIKAGLLPLQVLLKSRLPAVSELIFNRFLGDVQLYGESGTIRGRAMCEFHKTMASIHNAHRDENVKVRYTIIAHSLGTIMALDALMFAHHARHYPQAADKKATGGSSKDDGSTLFLKAYDEARPTAGTDEAAEKSLPGGPETLEEKISATATGVTDWVKDVDAFVTLGSPIDKFIVLWPLNYEYLLSDGWMAPELKKFREDHKIRHFNYCDEQDPVGHELDTAYDPTRKAVATLFGEKPVEDLVFNRYWIPGQAHLDYWQDDHLFRRILDVAVDQKELSQAHRLRWYDSWVFLKVLLFAYVGMPFVAWMVCSFAACWVWFADSWRTGIIAALVTGGLVFFSAIIMELLIKWRRLLIVKRSSYEEKCKEAYRGRKWLGRTVRTTVYAAPLIWAGGLYWLSQAAKELDGFQWRWLIPPFVRDTTLPLVKTHPCADIYIVAGIFAFTAFAMSVFILVVFQSAKWRFRSPP